MGTTIDATQKGKIVRGNSDETSEKAETGQIMNREGGLLEGMDRPADALQALGNLRSMGKGQAADLVAEFAIMALEAQAAAGRFPEQTFNKYVETMEGLQRMPEAIARLTDDVFRTFLQARGTGQCGPDTDGQVAKVEKAAERVGVPLDQAMLKQAKHPRDMEMELAVNHAALKIAVMHAPSDEHARATCMRVAAVSDDPELHMEVFVPGYGVSKPKITFHGSQSPGSRLAVKVAARVFHISAAGSAAEVASEVAAELSRQGCRCTLGDYGGAAEVVFG